MNKKKLIVCFVLAVVTLLTATLPVFALAESQEELVKELIPFSESTVEQDFERLKEEPGNNFNEENYPVVEVFYNKYNSV